MYLVIADHSAICEAASLGQSIFAAHPVGVFDLVPGNFLPVLQIEASPVVAF